MLESINKPIHFQAKISKEEMAQLPVVQFSENITLIKDTQAAEQELPEIAEQAILGFDTETRPSFEKGVSNRIALLQLSTSEKAWIFQLHKTGIPDQLKEVLTSDQITKVGVAIRDDIKALKTIRPFNPAGFIELQSLVKEHGIEDAGLKKLCGLILGFSISKSKRLSNWERESLTPSQLTYAATDAWVCARIYQTLLERSANIPTPTCKSNNHHEK